jgi:hypothetical protein
MNRGKLWTIEDDQYVIDKFNTKTVSELATSLGRTVLAVRLRYDNLKNPNHVAHTRLNNKESISKVLCCPCSPDTSFTTNRAYEQHKRNSQHIIHVLRMEIKDLRIALERKESEIRQFRVST